MTTPSRAAAPRHSPEPLAAEATVDLIERVKHGDDGAPNTLLERCIPALRRWARGRLPASARGMHDTADLVQDTIISAKKKPDTFDARHQGALQAYLRQSVVNRVRDLARYQKRRPGQTELPQHPPDRQVRPDDRVIDLEKIERYEQALQRLSVSDREAIVNRLEFQHSYEELAVVLAKPSAAAARMAVTRAMKRLASETLDV